MNVQNLASYSFEKFMKLKGEIKNHPLKLKVLTDSMLPIIQVDDEIDVENVELEDLKPFDIVVYFSKANNFICHVFIKEYDLSSSLMLAPYNGKGGSDFMVEKKMVLGRVTNKKLSVLNKVILAWNFGEIHSDLSVWK